MSSQPESNHRRALDRLLQRLADTLPNESDSAATPVSEELDELLWLFAESALSEQEEERLWTLAAQEPGAVHHFQQMLARMPIADPETAPSFSPRIQQAIDASIARARQTAAPQPLADRLPQLPSIMELIDWVVRITADGFLGGTALPLGLGAIRGPAEHVTTITRQLLRPIGIVNLTLDHAGSSRFHLSIQIETPSSNYPTATLQARLHLRTEPPGDSVPFQNRSTTFRDLPPGTYVLEFLSQDQVVDRYLFTLDATQTHGD